MANRREFIRSAFLSGLSFGFLNGKSANAEPPADITWDNLADQFSIKEGRYYLNTGTMGLSPISVQKTYIEVIEHVNATGSYGKYEKPLLAQLGKFLNCNEKSLALTRNVTEGINIATWGFNLKKGDEVIMTSHEHAGNALPWLNRSKKEGIKIRLIKLGQNGEETLQNIKAATTSKTRVIAVPHIPCTIGHVLPVKEICAFAKSKNIYSCIDGAHGPGMLSIDLEEMGCDVYASCFHKWMLGPKGLGFLYIKLGLIEEFNSYFIGAHSTGHWSFENEKLVYEGITSNTAHRYNYGTQSDSMHAAALSSIDFMNSLDKKEVESRIRKLNQQLTEELLKIENITVLASTSISDRGGIVSFKTPNHNFSEITTQLRQKNFVVRQVPESGVNCIRVSTHVYNNASFIEKFVEYLKGLVK